MNDIAAKLQILAARQPTVAISLIHLALDAMPDHERRSLLVGRCQFCHLSYDDCKCIDMEDPDFDLAPAIVTPLGTFSAKSGGIMY